MSKPWPIGALVAAMLAGCGPAVNPEEVTGPSCTDGCWNLSQTSVLKVNDFPFLTSLAAKEVHGWRFSTTPGRRYTVKVKVTSGRTNTYVSSKVVIDPRANTLTDYGSTRDVTFTAETQEVYVAVQDTGNLQGSVYGIRIVSYDENRDPLPGTVFLAVNQTPRSRSAVENTGREYPPRWRSRPTSAISARSPETVSVERGSGMVPTIVRDLHGPQK